LLISVSLFLEIVESVVENVIVDSLWVELYLKVDILVLKTVDFILFVVKEVLPVVDCSTVVIWELTRVGIKVDDFPISVVGKGIMVVLITDVSFSPVVDCVSINDIVDSIFVEL
jgi:hypothetical protein